MKRLIWSVIAVAIFGAPLAQTQRSSAVEALPAGCRVYDGANYAQKGALWCVVQESIKTGKGTSWGDSRYVTSNAPKGYKLRWSEAHVESKDHHCGVKDEGDENPSPLNKDNKRAGESFWAQCIIWERDDHHVVVKANIQGWEGEKVVSWFPREPVKWSQSGDWGSVGTVTLYTIYWPIT